MLTLTARKGDTIFVGVSRITVLETHLTSVKLSVDDGRFNRNLKEGESFKFGGADIKLQAGGSNCRLSFDAPKSISIDREVIRRSKAEAKKPQLQD